MSAAKYTIIVKQGSTFQLGIVYRDSNGDPIDLTGYDARMQVRKGYADFDDNIYADLTTTEASGSSLTITPPSGSIDILIGSEITEQFNFDDGLYDLEVVTGSFVDRILEGKVKVHREVTR